MNTIDSTEYFTVPTSQSPLHPSPQDDHVKLAVLSTVHNQDDTIRGLIRRFHDERNTPAVQAAIDLHQENLSQYDNDIDALQPDAGHYLTSRLYATATAAFRQIADTSIPPRPPDPLTPAYFWYRHRLRFLTIAQAASYLSDQSRITHAAGMTDILPSMIAATNRLHDLSQDIKQQTSHDEAKPPRPKNAAKRLIQQMTRTSSDLFDQIHKSYFIRRADMPVVYSQRLQGRRLDRRHVTQSIQEFRKSINDYVINVCNELLPDGHSTQQVDLIYMEGYDSIIVKRYDDAFPVTTNPNRTRDDISHHLQVIAHQCNLILANRNARNVNIQSAARIQDTNRLQHMLLESNLAFVPRYQLALLLHVIRTDLTQEQALRITEQLTVDPALMDRFVDDVPLGPHPHPSPDLFALKIGVPFKTVDMIIQNTQQDPAQRWRNLIQSPELSDLSHMIPDFLPEITGAHHHAPARHHIQSWEEDHHNLPWPANAIFIPQVI